jgi:GT2 family glycosyltransferase
MNDVTAIIKTFLRDDYLFDCVKSLRALYPGMPIAVADDGNSSDEKETKLRDAGVTKYIRMPFNSGLSAGRNVLIDACETPYFLLGDDDLLYTPETHIEYLRTLMGVADIAAGAFLDYGRYIYHYERNLVREPNGRFRLVHVTGWPPFSVYEDVRYGKCDLVHNIFVARTDIVRQIRWDEGIRIRYEHEDFFMSTWLQGTRVVYCPDVAVLHKLQGYADSQEYRSHREDDTASRAAFAKKWGFVW